MYLAPSSPDQAGFHEGFADIVALLSVFKQPEIVELGLAELSSSDGRLGAPKLTAKRLGETVLVQLGEQFGAALEGTRGRPLRHSVRIAPNVSLYRGKAYQEEHDRGELLVAIVMRTFLQIWERRLKPLLQNKRSSLLKSVVAEEGGTAANHLLTICIRALDYLPPVDMTYRDYLSALLTADREIYPDDQKYDYRTALRAEFAAYGILPASGRRSAGWWEPPPELAFSMTGIHFDRLQRDSSTMFRFVWENRAALGIFNDAFTRVTSVRPVIRVSRDGTVLRETVAEYIQTLRVYSTELKSLGIRKPDRMRRSRLITLYGGGTLVFSEFGQLKYHIGTGVRSSRQSERLQSLWDNGYFDEAAESSTARLTRIHRSRVLNPVRELREDW